MDEGYLGGCLLIGVFVLIVLLIIIFITVRFFEGFSHELWYLNSEIKRTKGEERKRWKRRRRRLWLSLLPFVRY